MSRRLVVVAFAAAVGAASAQGCGGDDGSRPAPELSGTYRLISAAGSPPPYIYWCSARGGCEQINGGRIEIMSRGRLRDIGEYQSVGAPATTADVDTIVAAYELGDSRLIIKRTFAGGSPIEYDDTAAVLNGVLQITLKPRMVNGRLANGGTFFYEKE